MTYTARTSEASHVGPRTFDTAREAWRYLADERWAHERDEMGVDLPLGATNTWCALDALAQVDDPGHGHAFAAGDHPLDPGVDYLVDLDPEPAHEVIEHQDQALGHAQHGEGGE